MPNFVYGVDLGLSLPEAARGDIVRAGMETVIRFTAKETKRPTRCVRMTQRTVSSTGSPLVFARISCFGGNPVKYTDPDGLQIKVTGDDGITYIWNDVRNDFYKSGFRGKRIHGTNDAFVKNVKESLLYLKTSKEASGKISELSGSIRSVTIARGEEKDTHVNRAGFLGLNSEVAFDPTMSLDIGDGSFQSAALLLYHELYHSYSNIIENKYLQRYNNNDVWPGNVNMEELNTSNKTDIVARQLHEPIRIGPYVRARYGPNLGSVRSFINNQY